MKNCIIWMCGFAIAVASALTAMGAIAKNKAPELAARMTPTNGFAYENMASASIKSAISANQGNFPDSVDPATMDLAKHAFRSEPATPEAIVVLALGNTEVAKRKLMYQAFALSRRQQLTTGWMIADSGARNDISEILSHYDTMLRTSASTASVIIPVMAGALGNDDFVEPFAELLAKKPPWTLEFWGAVVSNRNAIVNAARLRELLHEPNKFEQGFRDARLISALVQVRELKTAENLYQLLTDPAAEDRYLRNGSFENKSKFPPFDWQLFSTGEYGAAMADGTLQLSAIESSGGLFARQLVKIPAEIMEIEVKSNNGIPENANMAIRLSCAESIQSIPKPTNIPLTGKITQQQISNSESDCSFYWFDIVARATSSGMGFDATINSIRLQRNAGDNGLS